jgi:hypothetical protein
MGSSGDVKIFKSIQGVRKKRSIFCLVESSRPIPKNWTPRIPDSRISAKVIFCGGPSPMIPPIGAEDEAARNGTAKIVEGLRPRARAACPMIALIGAEVKLRDFRRNLSVGALSKRIEGEFQSILSGAGSVPRARHRRTRPMFSSELLPEWWEAPQSVTLRS